MGLIYALMAVLQALMWLGYYGLVYGVPLFILSKLVRNRRRPKIAALWAGFAVIWAVPAVVEYARDQQLMRWVATLPAAPFVMIKQGETLALQDAQLNPENGRAAFSTCIGAEYDTPLCSFSLGAESILLAKAIELGDATNRRALKWQARDDCDLEYHDNTLPDAFNGYLTAQGICAALIPTTDIPDLTLSYQAVPIPWFPGQFAGQLHATPRGAQQPISTLTQFDLRRPVFPALWGLHWLPVLAGILPDATTQVMHSKTYDEAELAAYPPLSMQSLVFNQGWNAGPAFNDDAVARLDALFPYQANRALPALRSNSFFPTRFAIELVCAPAFRSRITAEVVGELRRIAAQSDSIGNDYPRQLAVTALADGCGAGL